MTQQTKLIDISPHRSLLTKISQTGYTIQEALSELIDNAIDARLPRQKLKVAIDITPNTISISDNGSGMTEKKAADSIRLGYSAKKGQLGEFGLGLKTSTSFLGKAFTLTTTPKAVDEQYIVGYDEDHWLKHGDWYKYPFIIERGIEKDNSGTTIVIKQLKVNFSDRLLANIRDEFGMRFGPFIANGELELHFNGEICRPYIPQLLDDKKNEFTFTFIGGKAWGWWGYQLSGLNQSYYGFHTYRRGRLVTTYDKVGLTPNQDIKQIIGDLHIEGIPITHDKKSFLKSAEEYRALEAKLREYFKPFEKRPRRILSGYSASAGKVAGTVRRINMFMTTGDTATEMKKIQHGDIIVTEMTRPHFLLGIRRAGGIITDLGGNLSHAAIVAREFNIPAVVGTQKATTTLQDGQRIILDGNGGCVYEDQ
ncbi:MAG TPA: PEP-utilizing enzyme [Candidatus Saccharimonadia bacterium]|nr:PEP-utilizing enzyme [Candidatus Saccharimonadia bacterium]